MYSDLHRKTPKKYPCNIGAFPKIEPTPKCTLAHGDFALKSKKFIEERLKDIPEEIVPAVADDNLKVLLDER